MPTLATETYDRLRDDIRERGVLDAVIKDERGRILDGHHRAAIASELGIDYPVQILDLGNASDSERDAVAATLNINRRQLAATERRDLALRFRLAGVKLNDTAELVGAAPSTVRGWTSRPVGEARKVKIAEAADLIAAGHSQHEAARLVGLPRRTLSDRLGENAKSSAFAHSPRKAPTRTTTPEPRRAPRWTRHFTNWCAHAIPEDKEFLLRFDRLLHRAMEQAAVACDHNGG